MKREITEAEFEQLLDAAVMRRLRTDTSYTHAENAESQALAEEEISDQEYRRLCAKYGFEDER